MTRMGENEVRVCKASFKLYTHYFLVLGISYEPTDSSGPEFWLQFAMNLPPQRNICQLLPKLIYTLQSSGGSVNLQCFVYLSNNNIGNCV